MNGHGSALLRLTLLSCLLLLHAGQAGATLTARFTVYQITDVCNLTGSTDVGIGDAVKPDPLYRMAIFTDNASSHLATCPETCDNSYGVAVDECSLADNLCGTVNFTDRSTSLVIPNGQGAYFFFGLWDDDAIDASDDMGNHWVYRDTSDASSVLEWNNNASPYFTANPVTKACGQNVEITDQTGASNYRVQYRAWFEDDTAPTSPGQPVHTDDGLADTGYDNDNRFDLSWNASSDPESGISRYQLEISDLTTATASTFSLDNTLMSATACPSGCTVAYTPVHDHNYGVVVKAFNGNMPGLTSPASAYFGKRFIMVDLMPPSTFITSGGAWIRADATIPITDSDAGSGLATCYWRTESNGAGTLPLTERLCTSTVTLTVGSSRMCASQGVGACAVYARSTDQARNVAPDAFSSFNVDWTPDTIASLRAYQYDGGPAIAAGAWQTDDTPYIAWDTPAGAIAPIAGYSYAVDQPPDCAVDISATGVLLPALAEGGHTVQVRAVDAAGNCGTPTVIAINVDRTADAMDALHAYTAQGGQAIEPSQWQKSATPYFTWTAVAGLSPVAGYSHAMDAAADCTVDTTSPFHQTPTALSDGVHQFTVRVIDQAGNCGAASGFAVWVDRTAEAVTNLAVYDQAGGSPLAPDQWHHDLTPHVAWAAPAGGLSPVAGYSYAVDQPPDCIADTTSTFFSLDAAPLADGIHTFTVRALDAAGNCAEGVSVTYRVDVTGETVSDINAFASPGVGRFNEATWQNDADPYFTWAAPAGPVAPVTGYSVALDQDPDCVRDTEQAAWDCQGHPLTGGVHTLRVRALDAAGNCGVPASFEVWVDSVADVVTNLTVHDEIGGAQITPAAWQNDADPVVTWTAPAGMLSPVEGYTLGIDQDPGCAAFDTSTLRLVEGPLSDGVHTLVVRLLDEAGNCGPGVNFVLWVDHSPDSVATFNLYAGESGPALSQTAWQKHRTPYLRWTPPATPASPIVGYSVGVDTEAACAVATTATGLSVDSPLDDGEHSFFVRPMDQAGNCGRLTTATLKVDATGEAVTGLRAYTHDGGAAILPSTWQTDTDPFLVWDAPINLASPIAGYALGLNSPPQCAASILATSLQMGSHALAEGVHTVYIRAMDQAGNCGVPASIELWVAASSLTLAITDITPDPAKLGDTVAITLEASATVVTTPTVTVADNPAFMTGQQGNRYTFSYIVTGTETPGQAAEGEPAAVKANAEDLAGNQGSTSGSFVIDLVAPALSSPPTASRPVAAPGTTVILAIAVTETLAEPPLVTVNETNTAPVQAAGFRRYTAACMVSATDPEGPASARIRMQDLAGNTATTPLSALFAVDRTPPSVADVFPGGGQVLSAGAPVMVSWTTTDANRDTVDIYLSRDSGATFDTLVAQAIGDAGVFSYTVEGPACDTLRFKVVATDKAGLFGEGASAGDVQVTMSEPDHVIALADDGLALLSEGEEVALWVVDKNGTPMAGSFLLTVTVNHQARITDGDLANATFGQSSVVGRTGEDGRASVHVDSDYSGDVTLTATAQGLPREVDDQPADILFVQCQADDDCPGGKVCDATIYTCVLTDSRDLCEPCQSDIQCVGEQALCLMAEGETYGFCGMDCTQDSGICPEGYVCSLIRNAQDQVVAIQCTPPTSKTCADMTADGDLDQADQDDGEVQEEAAEVDESGDLDEYATDDSCFPGALHCVCADGDHCGDGLACVDGRCIQADTDGDRDSDDADTAADTADTADTHSGQVKGNCAATAPGLWPLALLLALAGLRARNRKTRCSGHYMP